MFGWRGRLGFLVPPGCPTVEGEVPPMMPVGATAHFSRMVAHGTTGSLDGQLERNQSMLKHLDESAEMLAMVKPRVMALAHTASSYTLGREGEADLVKRMEAAHQIPFVTAFGSVIEALARLNVKRIALGAPYNETMTLQGKAHLELHGIEVVNHGRLDNVTNIYDETAERAYTLARKVDVPEADAVFMSGVGLPTMSALELLEQDLGKPVISSMAALTWLSLRTAGIREPIQGYGRLLTL
jgi:maleate cis-trans isomerase